LHFVSQINIWNYCERELIHSIDTGHSENIFCTKFVPETRDELVVSGAGDAEVTFSPQARLICFLKAIHVYFQEIATLNPFISFIISILGSSFQYISFKRDKI